jgi:hypothetical protein
MLFHRTNTAAFSALLSVIRTCILLFLPLPHNFTPFRNIAFAAVIVHFISSHPLLLFALAAVSPQTT